MEGDRPVVILRQAEGDLPVLLHFVNGNCSILPKNRKTTKHLYIGPGRENSYAEFPFFFRDCFFLVVGRRFEPNEHIARIEWIRTATTRAG